MFSLTVRKYFNNVLWLYRWLDQCQLTGSEKLPTELNQSTFLWFENQLIKLSMAVGVISSNLLLLYFLIVGCCILCAETHSSSIKHMQLLDKQWSPLFNWICDFLSLIFYITEIFTLKHSKIMWYVRVMYILIQNIMHILLH